MLNIALPDQVAAFVEEQATAAGFNTANEYVYHLIVREQERLAEQRQVEALLLEGLESGSPIEATDDWWNRKRSQLIKRVHQPEVIPRSPH
ncbi:MAG: type II toxin-antitoxin system ParD family antitoxin [Drouetiella hepatica Uher 2000/2452]|jgi:antitoxin ParD1/3/4|uniref:Type II toxin-antitoxin system ParD family antitoxin n=1 Tax=Drouetiella hepatica Uher 2000/2452 TaxID=904376 RepID=A0A951UKK9_9CYAN|nr:type II toxin-antitoxin system ParD family antitoxin [Drouetiella hepatica Uher 2000/2452]